MHGLEQRFFCGFGKQAFVDIALYIVGFFQDVANAFVGGSQGLAFRQCGKSTHGLQATRDVREFLWTQGQDGFDFLRRETLFTQTGRQAVVKKRSQWHMGIGNRATKYRYGLANDVRQRQGE